MQLNDHVKRFVENEVNPDEIHSPMDPPESYAPSTIEKVPVENLPALLKQLVEEHVFFNDRLVQFEKALLDFKKNGFQFTQEISATFREFFLMYDYHMVPHHLKEEKILFPLLAERLIEKGEHNSLDESINPIDVMEDDHAKLGQTNALVFNLLGLGARLPDPRSRNMIFEHAVSQGLDMVERLKLHIFKEDDVIFQQANHLLTKDELAAMQAKAELRFRNHAE